MKEIKFIRNKNLSKNVYSFDGEYFYIYDVNEKSTYKFNKTAKYLYELLDKPMSLSGILDYFKNLHLSGDGDLNSFEDELFNMLDIFVENALIKYEEVEI